MKKLTLFILLIILLPILAFSYDKSAGSFEWFTEGGPPPYAILHNTVVRIHTTGTGTAMIPIFKDDTYFYEERIGIFKMEANGVLIDQFSIVTAAHVVIPSNVKVNTAQSCFHISKIVREIKKDILIGDVYSGMTPAYVFFADIENDIAILKLYEPWMPAKPLPYEVVKTHDFIFHGFMAIPYNLLEIGDAVAVVTQRREGENGDRHWTFEARYGKVINLIPQGGKEEPLFEMSHNEVTTDLEIYPGDSGSPIFAFKEGKPVLVGIITKIHISLKYSYFTRIDFARKVIFGK